MKKLDEVYELCLLKEEHIKTLYEWTIEEKNFEYYTCRPLRVYKSLEEYARKVIESISSEKEKNYVLVKRENHNMLLGKITLFDLNSRNHSGEFGYYLPAVNRGQGLGEIMIRKFLEASFMDRSLSLNKIYATTASNNNPSIKVLEKIGFNLDGRLRQHYWINDEKYDQLIYSKLKSEWI